jgi:hypothetical protein
MAQFGKVEDVGVIKNGGLSARVCMNVAPEVNLRPLSGAIWLLEWTAVMLYHRDHFRTRRQYGPLNNDTNLI